MKVIFGDTKLEILTSKFIIRFAGYLHDNDIHDISVFSVDVTKVDELNSITEIAITTRTNAKYLIKTIHANDMSCIGWETRLIPKHILINPDDLNT